jgi:hypothetical protein
VVDSTLLRAATDVFMALTLVPVTAEAAIGSVTVNTTRDYEGAEIFGPTVPSDGQLHNHLVYGSIDRSADAWEILLDAARLLKDPGVYPGRHGPAQ